MYWICRNGCRWMLPVLLALLAACGGSGNDAQLSPNETVPSDSRTTVSVRGIELDFKDARDLFGSRVAVERGPSGEVEAVAQERAILPGMRVGPREAIEIRLAKPTSSSVSIRVLDVDGSSLADDEVFVLHAFTPGDPGLDGGPSLDPLSTQFDATTKHLTARVPGEYFVEYEALDGATARLVLLIQRPIAPQGSLRFEGRSVPLANGAPSSESINGSHLVDCPFAHGCIETSLRNPLRKFPDSPTKKRDPRPHKGTDFKAAVGTQLFAPEGSRLITGISPDEHKWLGSPKGYGVNLVLLHPNGAVVRYAHLSEIGSWALEQDPEKPAGLLRVRRDQPLAPSLAAQRSTDASITGSFVARTGSTGTESPHLHMEVESLASSVVDIDRFPLKSCATKLGSFEERCVFSYQALDAFHAMVKTMSFQLSAGRILPADQSSQVTVRAWDSGRLAGNGQPVEVSSNVGNATPTGTFPGDPARLLCIWDLDGDGPFAYGVNLVRYPLGGATVNRRQWCKSWSSDGGADAARFALSPTIRRLQTKIYSTFSRDANVFNDVRIGGAPYAEARVAVGAPPAQPPGPVWEMMALPYVSRHVYLLEDGITTGVEDRSLTAVGLLTARRSYPELGISNEFAFPLSEEYYYTFDATRSAGGYLIGGFQPSELGSGRISVGLEFEPATSKTQQGSLAVDPVRRVRQIAESLAGSWNLCNVGPSTGAVAGDDGYRRLTVTDSAISVSAPGLAAADFPLPIAPVAASQIVEAREAGGTSSGILVFQGVLVLRDTAGATTYSFDWRVDSLADITDAKQVRLRGFTSEGRSFECNGVAFIW